MFYLVIGIVLVVVSAIITQRSRHRAELQEEKQGDGTQIQGAEAGNVSPGDSVLQAKMEPPEDVMVLSRPAETGAASQKELTEEPTSAAAAETSSPRSSSFETVSYGVEEEIVPLKPLLAAAP
ncbi:MAG: hypothetical protein LBO68_01460, partial [Synergistaceae bacterium]|nr:hypothetical protein [Synergistaceae bacterium]